MPVTTYDPWGAFSRGFEMYGDVVREQQQRAAMELQQQQLAQQAIMASQRQRAIEQHNLALEQQAAERNRILEAANLEKSRKAAWETQAQDAYMRHVEAGGDPVEGLKYFGPAMGVSMAGAFRTNEESKSAAEKYALGMARLRATRAATTDPVAQNELDKQIKDMETYGRTPGIFTASEIGTQKPVLDSETRKPVLDRYGNPITYIPRGTGSIALSTDEARQADALTRMLYGANVRQMPKLEEEIANLEAAAAEMTDEKGKKALQDLIEKKRATLKKATEVPIVRPPRAPAVEPPAQKSNASDYINSRIPQLQGTNAPGVWPFPKF